MSDTRDGGGCYECHEAGEEGIDAQDSLSWRRHRLPKVGSSIVVRHRHGPEEEGHPLSSSRDLGAWQRRRPSSHRIGLQEEPIRKPGHSVVLMISRAEHPINFSSLLEKANSSTIVIGLTLDNISPKWMKKRCAPKPISFHFKILYHSNPSIEAWRSRSGGTWWREITSKLDNHLPIQSETVSLPSLLGPPSQPNPLPLGHQP